MSMAECSAACDDRKEDKEMEAKTMRKHIAIILAIFAAIFFLGGCSSTPTPTETTD